MLQEVWLRWQKQSESDIQSAKAWLVSTMTRLCIDQLRVVGREREEYYGIWLPEPLMASEANRPDEAAALADSLTMAFMMMLETLDPVERAVFLLREVFSFDYADIATTVGKSEANCRQIVRRAKLQLEAKPKPAKPSASSSEQAQRLVDEFLAAAGSGDVKELLAMLTEDAVVLSDGGGKVRAAGRPIISGDHVSRFFIGVMPRFPGDTEWVRAMINGRVGMLMKSQGEVFGTMSFEFAEDRIQQVYVVLNPDKLKHL